jgi:hypothetical protein
VGLAASVVVTADVIRDFEQLTVLGAPDVAGLRFVVERESLTDDQQHQRGAAEYRGRNLAQGPCHNCNTIAHDVSAIVMTRRSARRPS